MDEEQAYCAAEGRREALVRGLDEAGAKMLAEVIHNARVPALAYIAQLKEHIAVLEGNSKTYKGA